MPRSKECTIPSVCNDAPMNNIAPIAGCSACPIKNVCIPATLASDDVVRLTRIIHATRFIKEGETLYRRGDVFNSIYAIRAGSFKTTNVNAEGREQIGGFHLPGELIGLDGISEQTQACDAVALETSAVCTIPFGSLENLCREARAIQHHLHRVMSLEICRKSGLMSMLGSMSAEQRLASFLLNLSERLLFRGASGITFSLQMNRHELSSYLGMKLETVSRMFSRFQRAGLLLSKGRRVTLLDSKRLAEI